MLHLFFDFEKINKTDFDKFLSEMPEFRRDKILALKNIKDQLRSLFSFMVLCVALERKVEEFRTTKLGKPMLKNDDFSFSISHTKECVAVAISENAIGVDVEYIRDYPQKVITRILTNEEKTQLMQSKKPNVKFFRFWTLKESFVKCIGTGIIFSLKKIEFNIKAAPYALNKNIRDKFNFLEYSLNNYQISICKKSHREFNVKLFTYEELKEKWEKLQCQ